MTLDDETVTGTVSATSQSGFDLRPWGDKSRPVVRSEIELLERSLGTQTYKKRGFLLWLHLGPFYPILAHPIAQRLCSHTQQASGSPIS